MRSHHTVGRPPCSIKRRGEATASVSLRILSRHRLSLSRLFICAKLSLTLLPFLLIPLRGLIPSSGGILVFIHVFVRRLPGQFHLKIKLPHVLLLPGQPPRMEHRVPVGELRLLP